MKPGALVLAGLLLGVEASAGAQSTAPSPVVVPATPPVFVPTSPPPADRPNARSLGAREQEWPRLDPAEAREALAAFWLGCRADPTYDLSYLTRREDWRPACEEIAAAGLDAVGRDPLAFLRRHFDWVEVGDGAALATGFAEREIRASRTRAPGFEVPVYTAPRDLLYGPPEDLRGVDRIPADAPSQVGRIDEAGDFVPYYERGEIERGALTGRGLEIAWVGHPTDLLAIGLRGQLRFPDGSTMRISPNGANGAGGETLASLMRQRGLRAESATDEAMLDWLRAHSAEARALIGQTRGYVFFGEIAPRPTGSGRVALTPGVSTAVDPYFVPVGAIVQLSGMADRRADGLWVAQRENVRPGVSGANRFDLFWGVGDQAVAAARGMEARGRALILLPRGAIERVRARAPAER